MSTYAPHAEISRGDELFTEMVIASRGCLEIGISMNPYKLKVKMTWGLGCWEGLELRFQKSNDSRYAVGEIWGFVMDLYGLANIGKSKSKPWRDSRQLEL